MLLMVRQFFTGLETCKLPVYLDLLDGKKLRCSIPGNADFSYFVAAVHS